MVGLDCRRMSVAVDYSLSYAELARRLRANGIIQQTIVENPRWCVIDLPQPGKVSSVEMCLYELDRDVPGLLRAHRMLIGHNLRPALLHEAVSLSQAVPGLLNWACLGVLWGPSANLYYRQLKGRCRLHFSGYSLGAKTIIPAVPFSGSWNKLPGMGI